MTKSFLSAEITKIIESGIDRQLNQSIFYSPFRLFYRLFKRSNPQLIQRVREIVRQDIENILTNISFEAEFFITHNYLNPNGKLLMKKCFNIGIRIIKKLSIKMAFKAFRDQELQQQIYDYILKKVEESVLTILEENNPKALR